MGHADIATTMIYVHHVPQHDAADKLGALVTLSSRPLDGVDEHDEQGENDDCRHVSEH
jgi:hypothetical protein